MGVGVIIEFCGLKFVRVELDLFVELGRDFWFFEG